MKTAPLLLATLWSFSFQIFAATSDEPKGHPLEVYNGSGSGNYGSGETVTITGTRPAGRNTSASTNSDTPDQQNDWVFIRWLKPEGNGRIEDPSAETTTLTMSDKKTVVVAVYGKINAWFPPGKETSSKGLLLPKNPQSQEQFRLEHRTRVTISLEEGSDVLTPATVWDQISVTLGWFPSRECEGIWHSKELVKYWDNSSQGTEISWETSIPKSQFEEKSPGVYEASVWYEGNWTMDQLPSKVDEDKNPVMPKALTGFGLVIHAPKYSKTLQGTHGTLGPVDLAVDANRDGTIKFAGNFKNPIVAGKHSDETTYDNPLRFWCNDDQDDETGEVVPAQRKDSESRQGSGGAINSKRDLEDYARLWMYFGGLQAAIADESIKVGLKWKNTGTTNPSINIYLSASDGGTDSYLKSDSDADAQMAEGKFGVAHVAGSNAVIIQRGSLPLLRTPVWEGLSDTKPCKYFLFDGVTEGKGELCISFHDKDGKEIGDGGSVWLELMNIKKMYVRAKGTPLEGIAAPYESYTSQPNPPLTGYIEDLNGHAFSRPPDEADSLVVFVHGIHSPFTNTTDAYNANIVSAEIIFKRLWHQGFKGRFAFYKWPALNPAGIGSTGFEFNGSEYRAWKYGHGLANFVNSINKSSKNLYAHSQGNIVCGAALTDYGLTVDNYVLTQAAVPAGCYDVSGGQNDSSSINGYPRFWNKEANKPTPDFAADLGYRGYLATLGVTGNVTNFHNFDDYALATGRTFWLLQTHWEANQDTYKPDDSFSNTNWYTYIEANANGKRCQLVDAFLVGRFVADSHESMSLLARPRSKAVGARASVRGSIDGQLDLSAFRDSAGKQVFTRASDDHGAQVGRRIQEVWEYYTELGRSLGVLPLHE